MNHVGYDLLLCVKMVQACWLPKVFISCFHIRAFRNKLKIASRHVIMIGAKLYLC